ncbi:hypothetical protein [Methanosarcina acetivorans]|nr:hypothetical protein [Methanosarcina acetivorans]
MKDGDRKVSISLCLKIKDAIFLDGEKGNKPMSAFLREIIESYIENLRDLKDSNDKEPAKIVSAVGTTVNAITVEGFEC